MAGKVDPVTGQPTSGSGSFNTYQGAPLPFNPDASASKHAYQQAIAQLKTQKEETLDYYGYNDKGRVDPFNSYGAVQMQSRTQGDQLKQLYGAQVGSGLQGSGLAKGQRNQALFAQGAEQAGLLKEFQSRMDAIRAGRQEARWTNANDQVSGTMQAILSAINAGQFTPAAPYRR